MRLSRRKTRLGALALLVTLASAAPAFADPALDERERVATRKTIDTTILAQYHGTYKAVRDQQYHGDGGLVRALDAWMTDTHAWVGQWGTLLALVDQAGSIPFARIEAEAQALIERQDAALAALTSSAEAIRIKAASAAATLSKREVPADGSLAQYREVVSGLTRRYAELTSAFANLSQQAKSRTDELAEIRRVTEAVALAKLRAALLAAGGQGLEDSLTRFRELLDAERILGRAFVALDTLEKAALVNESRMRLFHLEANATDARRECARLRQTVAASALAPRYKQAALQRADRHCNAIERLYRDLLAVDGAAVLVGDYADTVKARAQSVCRGSRPMTACEKFAVLAAIPFDRVRQMTPAQLAVYEREWAAVEEAFP